MIVTTIEQFTWVIKITKLMILIRFLRAVKLVKLGFPLLIISHLLSTIRKNPETSSMSRNWSRTLITWTMVHLYYSHMIPYFYNINSYLIACISKPQSSHNFFCKETILLLQMIFLKRPQLILRLMRTC